MDSQYIQSLLTRYKSGKITSAEILRSLKNFSSESLGFATIDHHRHFRQGFPEVIFCQGKTASQVAQIAKKIVTYKSPLLATRATRQHFTRTKKVIPTAKYYPDARVITANEPRIQKVSKRPILIVTAGTSDIAVAEEAALTARMFGRSTDRLYDVGVAGIHRLLQRSHQLYEASVIIVVAGMDGALPSVIGGMVNVPVIAVPTSTGYGASFNGVAALLTMLNSCAAGVLVVNIDNGFGAGFAASLMTQHL
jgi:NCAIR mutase (PurE)-related protein